MATSRADIWTVLLVADEEEMTRTYRLPKDTTVADVLSTWKMNLDTDDNWVLTTDNKEETYDEQSTLEMIGETSKGSKIINFRIVECPDPTPVPVTDIFVVFEGKCHRVEVLLTDKLWRILPGGRTTEYHCDGRPMDLSLTIMQSRLKNNAVVYEACCRVAVRLSNGTMKSIKVPKSALVHHLKAKVREFESGDFNLRYQERILDVGDSVRELRKTVEVVTTEFEVNIEGQNFKVKTGRGDIKFTEFVGLMQVESGFNFLDQCSFYCQGCGRRISKSQEEFQVLRIKCCSTESLELICGRPEMTVTATQTRIERNESNEETSGTAPLLIVDVNLESKGREARFLKVDLPTPMTLTHVRRATEKKWGWSPRHVVICRGIAAKNKARCVHVCNADDEPREDVAGEFSDVSGNTWTEGQVYVDGNKDMEFLPEDEPIQIWGRRRNIFFAVYFTNSVVPASIYIRNERDGGQDFLLTLRGFPSPFLKPSIANQLKVHWDEIRLMLWTGQLPDGTKCCHVCDADGKFIDGVEGGAEFEDNDGFIHGKGELKNTKREPLPDVNYVEIDKDMKFPDSSGRRPIIYVTSAQ